MKGLVEEYGGIVILVVVSITIMLTTYTGVSAWFEEVFPELGTGGEELRAQDVSEPVLIVVPIEFEVGSEVTEESVRTEIKAYRDSSLSEELLVTVNGLGQLDSSIQGVQYLLYSVQGDTGAPISRKGIVLFY